MKKFYLNLIIALFLTINSGFSQEKKFKIHTIGFYNVDNLFDTPDDPLIYDEEYTPSNGWTQKNYEQKIENLAKVILEIGTDENGMNGPTVLGVCEVENKGVLEDLIKHPLLRNRNYSIVHYDSPDKRGIDVGLLYQSKYFTPVSSSNIPLYIYKDSEKNGSPLYFKPENGDEATEEDRKAFYEENKRIYTRDQLLVTGYLERGAKFEILDLEYELKEEASMYREELVSSIADFDEELAEKYLEGEEINFIVNHWPSRSGGEKKSSPNREAAGKLNRVIIDSLLQINHKAKIITMGDLNDDPTNISVKENVRTKAEKEELVTNDMYNPMEKMFKQGVGTLGYRDAWNLFDQMIVSEPLVNTNYKEWTYWKAGVHNKPFMLQEDGRWKGYPKRNSNGVPGYSDHFPVYVYLIKQVN